MDRELETYVENVMEKQQYRSGIFTGWLQQILRGIAVTVVWLTSEVPME